MPPVRFAFVGSTREVTPSLLRALARIGTLEAICDQDAEQDAARYHARWTFSDLSVMLREAEPDGVVLQRPLGDRTRVIKQCLAAGAGVLVCGAPGTTAACRRLASFSKLAGRFVLAAPAIRFSPAILLARRLVESGKLGAPISVTLQSTRRGAPRPGKEDGGAVPSDQVFEAVDLVHHLIGPVEQAFALAHAEGAMTANLMTTPGVPVALVLHASGSAEAVGLELEIRAADGTRLHLDRDMHLLCGNGSRVDAAHRVPLALADPAIELGHEALVAEFRRCLQAGGSGPGLVGPVAAVVAAVEAILGSAARRRPLAPKPIRGDVRPAAARSVGSSPQERV